MTFLVTVETGNMTQVLASRVESVGDIDLSGWGGTRVISSPLVFQAMLLFLLFPSFSVRGFSAFETVKRGCFMSPGLRFFNPEVFYKTVIALTRGGIGWPGILRIMLVCFTSSETRTEYCLGLGIDYFLYCVLEAVQFAIVLLHFGPDRRF